jgi:hypothetical protein
MSCGLAVNFPKAPAANTMAGTAKTMDRTSGSLDPLPWRAAKKVPRTMTDVATTTRHQSVF